MPEPALSLLFICTHNRCRSILCEAVARHLGRGRISAYSAGSQPAGAVHPDTLRQLELRGIPTGGLCSQSWEELADVSADAVITVCDSAAGEQCPLWLGQTLKVHWGLVDPSKEVEGAARDAAFERVIAIIEQRISGLLSLGPEHLRGEALRAALVQLAEGG